jgi:type II secretory pathway pseudopilin PulG
MVRQDRFSLSDSLMVVAVILVIAALAVPNLLRPQIAANEAAAVNLLLAINSAQLKYAAAKPNVGFACALSALSGPGLLTAGPADPALAGGSKNGYRFSITGCSGRPATSYLVVARPAAPNKTGVRVFCSDQTGIVRLTPDIRLACTTRSRPVQ